MEAGQPVCESQSMRTCDVTAALLKLNYAASGGFYVCLIGNCSHAVRALESSSLLDDNLKKLQSGSRSEAWPEFKVCPKHFEFSILRSSVSLICNVFFFKNLFIYFYKKLQANGTVFVVCSEEGLRGHCIVAF